MNEIKYYEIKYYDRKLANSLLSKSDKKYKPLHLGKRFNASGRLESKLLAKAEWFKQKRLDETEKDQPQIFKKTRGCTLDTMT